MKTATGNYSLLIQKLDEFIRKYYLNKIIGGIIFTIASLLFAVLILSLGEYFFYFSTGIRTFLYYFFILLALTSTCIWIIIPAIKYYRLGSIISYEKAAVIIGKYFSNVNDKLINTLQLKKISDSDPDPSLIEASINQKINELKNFSFLKVINLRLNNRYFVRYLTPTLLIIAALLIISPRVLTEGTNRLFNHDRVFVKEAPFQFNILNKSLSALQNDDYTLSVSITGKVIPQEISINISNANYKLEKKSKNIFQYKFSNLNNDIPFVLSANDFNSNEYLLKVIPKPTILKFNIDAAYPKYIKRVDESFSNTGDITVPQGTKLNWLIDTRNTSAVEISALNQKITTAQVGEDKYSAQKIVMTDMPYHISLENKTHSTKDSFSYQIIIIPDQYPSIQVNTIADSLQPNLQYFIGKIGDDYGINNLEFKYTISIKDSSSVLKSIKIKTNNSKSDDFTYTLNINELNLNPGDNIDYYFEVWDNDGVNGSKSTKSSILSYKVPTLNEFIKNNNENNKEFKNELESALNKLNEINKKISEAQDNLMQKKSLDWDDKKKIQDLLESQKEIYKKIESLQKDLQKNSSQNNQFQQFTPELLEKQEKLNEISQKVLSPEMKELMQKMQELMDKMNKDQAQDQLKKNQDQSQQVEKELDRMLSLFKQLEFEQKFNSIKDQLNDAARQQDDLNKELRDDKKVDQKDIDKQNEINKKFNDIKEQMSDLKDLNKELENPMEMPDMKDKEESVDKELQNSKNELSKGNKSKAGESQKKASKDMKDMAKAMEDFMQSSEEEQAEEDMNAIRQIIENLVSISVKQEDIIDRTKSVNTNNPNYLTIIKEQDKLVNDIKMVEDSIQKLAKRQFQIKTYVDEQLGIINDNQSKSTNRLIERNPYQATGNQQTLMTSVNNLALIFNEQLSEMQKQMQNSKPGNGTCKKPGGNKPSLGDMGKMQKQLNDKISKMEGKSKGGQKPGQQSGQSETQQFSEMATQQAAIRNALKQLNDQNSKNGQGSNGEINKLLELMDKTEKELANKELNTETIQRQQEILTRLLEAENADKERDIDNKRKSSTADDKQTVIPPSFLEYIKMKQNETETLKTLPPKINQFYKSLLEEYYNQIGN